MSAKERDFLFLWSLGTALVIGLSLFVTPSLTPVLAGGLAGLAIGLGQWLILRQRLSHAQAWVGATALGCLVGVLSIDRLGMMRVHPMIYLIGAYLSLGALIGAAQWLILRRFLSRASTWIAISTISYLAGIIALALMASVMRPMTPATQLFSAIVPGLVIGVLSGIGLNWMLRHPVPGQPGENLSSAS